eukprot:scaffold16062_cov81-Phaeocystis_antarctica.AAC.7
MSETASYRRNGIVEFCREGGDQRNVQPVNALFGCIPPPLASSQGDVRSSPMAYPAVRPLPKLPLPLRPETRTTSSTTTTCSART